MKNLVFIAALIFSAFASSAIAQEASPSPNPSPETATWISTANPTLLPVQSSNPDTLKLLSTSSQQSVYVRAYLTTRFERK